MRTRNTRRCLAAELAGQYDHVYYLGNGKWNDSFEHQFRQVYTNTITQSTDENYSNTGRRIIMFPLSYQEVSYTVSLYAYWGEEQNLSYPASTCAGAFCAGRDSSESGGSGSKP